MATDEERGVSTPASAFAVAERLLSGITLTVSQAGHLRAIDHKYQQYLYTLLQGAHRAPTDTERSQLDEIATRDIIAMLTPAQRLRLRGN